MIIRFSDLKFKLPKIEFFILLALLTISAAIRFYINFYTDYMPGAAGAYYLVQVRSIIESGSLMFKEFPLVFYLEAAFVKLTLLISPGDINSAVDFTSRAFDAVIPALSIIPSYFLIKKIFGEKKNKTAIILISSLSIYYFTFFVLVSDYQKNSLGLVWLFFLILFSYKSLIDGSKKNYLFAVLFFVLTALTHFGCFVIAILFAVVLISVKTFGNYERKKLYIFLSLIAGIAVTGILALLIFSPSRFGILKQVSRDIYDGPIIIELLRGEQVLSPLDIFNIIFLNCMWIAGLILFIKKKNTIVKADKIFLLSLIVVSFIISSPLLWSEWAIRFYYIAYVFIIPILAMIFISIDFGKFKRKLFAAIAFLLIFSAAVTISKKPVSNMDSIVIKN